MKVQTANEDGRERRERARGNGGGGGSKVMQFDSIAFLHGMREQKHKHRSQQYAETDSYTYYKIHPTELQAAKINGSSPFGNLYFIIQIIKQIYTHQMKKINNFH